MSTVLGEVELVFADSTVVEYSVERPASLLEQPGDVWQIVLDVPALVDLYGPLEAATYTASIVPVPASILCLGGAIAWLAMRRRPKVS